MNITTFYIFNPNQVKVYHLERKLSLFLIGFPLINQMKSHAFLSKNTETNGSPPEKASYGLTCFKKYLI